MNLFEGNTQVFIIRIWFEPRGSEEAAQEWRGVIEQIPTGNRRYFRRMEDIARIIRDWMGTDIKESPAPKPIYQWVRQLMKQVFHWPFRKGH